MVFGQRTPQILCLYTVPDTFVMKTSRICPTAEEQKMDKRRDMSDQQAFLAKGCSDFLDGLVWELLGCLCLNLSHLENCNKIEVLISTTKPSSVPHLGKRR